MAKNSNWEKMWCTGCDVKEIPQCNHPAQWPGTNALGFAVMIARERIRTEAKNDPKRINYKKK